ncbi:MAG: PQQ-binding-like beta-propeller repeat protein [Cyclobacteriaceae bacterium]
MLKKQFFWFALILCACTPSKQKKASAEKEVNAVPAGTLEVVAELNVCPGNIALSKDGRIFLTTHGMRQERIQLLELLDNNQYHPFPDSSYQTDPGHRSLDKFDTPLGTFVDHKDRLWTIDAGFGLGLKGRLFAFDINTGEELYRFDLPSELTPPTSCVQDLVVDEKNEWVYLSDSGDPGIVVLEIATGEWRKFQDITMQPEQKMMVINGDSIRVNGGPFIIGMNPISISVDRETIYYGAMNANKWYGLEAALFRNKVSDEDLSSAVKVIGDKPFCDGVSTDSKGRHYLSNMQEHSIDVLDSEGNLSQLVQDERIDWPDNVRVGPDGWLYISTNQLYKASPFTGGEDQAVKPYHILRVKM